MTMSKIAVAEISSEGWKSWQIALAVGIPATVVGFFMYKKYSKKNEQAIDTSATQSNKAPSDVNAQTYKKRGNKFFMCAKYEEAIECYSKAIELGSEVQENELSTFHQNRAAAYEHMKNYVQVIADCTKALELNPKYIKALNRRAKAYRTTGFLTECLDDVTAACIFENFSNQGNIYLADEIIKELSLKRTTEKLKNRPPFEPSATYVWTVLKSFSQDPVFKYEKANLKNEEIMKDNENKSHFKTALKEFYADNFKNVNSLCTEELNTEGSGHKLEALLMRGTFNFLKGQFDLALEDFHAILATEDVDKKFAVNVLIKEAKIKLQKNEIEAAMELFQKAEEVDPNNPDIYMHRGQFNLILDNLEMAIADFEKSISLHDNLSTPHVHKCLAEGKKLRESSSSRANEKAMKAFDALVDKFPKCADVYSFYGQTLMELKMFEEADKMFDKAITLDPINPTAYVHKGILKLTQSEDYDGAITQLTKAVEVDGKSSFALQALGSVQLQRGSLDQAIKVFEQAIDVSPNEAEIAHLYSLLLSAEVQVRIARQQGVQLPAFF